MRVLALLRDFPSAANPQAGIFMLRRLQAIARLGHTVSVVRIVPFAPPLGSRWASYRSTPDEDVVEGIPVRSIRAIMPPRLIAMETVAGQVQDRLAREIERFGADVLHASFIIPCGHAAVRQNVPTIVSAHGVDTYGWPFRRRGLKRAACEALLKATRLSAVSGSLAKTMQQLAPREVRVIWNGADERIFGPADRAAARQKLEIPQDRFVIAYAGNLLRAKGLFELLEATQRISGCAPLLCIAGTGSDEAELRAAALERHVDVRFLGRREQSEVANLIAACDVFTLPSYYEGLPNAVCEAMLSARAVVASTAGGIPEIVEHGVAGLLVPPRDARALAEALDQLAAQPDCREAMARAANAFAERNLTWASASREYEALYEEAIAAYRPVAKTAQGVR